VTRWPLLPADHQSLQNPIPGKPDLPAIPNNYELAGTALGLRDDNNNDIPDLAYVTGTGAHDIITLSAQPNGTVDVTVEAYTTADETDPTRAQIRDTYSYSINLTSETEGKILVEPSSGDDKIILNGNFTAGNANAEIEIRASLGDDVLEISSGVEISKIRFEGEEGNDANTVASTSSSMVLEIFGGPGNDVLRSGEGADILSGGADADTYYAKGAAGASPFRDTLIDAVIVGEYGVGSNANEVNYEGSGFVDIEFSYDPDPFDGVSEIATVLFEAYAIDGRETTMAMQVIDELFDVVQASSSDPQWDIDGDGDVDGFLTTGLNGQADIDSTNSDIDYFVLKVLGTNYGDANLDGKVNEADLNILALQWLKNYGFLSSWGLADFNGDGEIDAADLNLIGDQWQWSNVISNA